MSKIVLYGNQLQFNDQQGDFIHFLFTSPVLKNCISKFNYINFCDLNNFVSPAVNPAQIGYLSSHKNVNILASIRCAADKLPNI